MLIEWIIAILGVAIITASSIFVFPDALFLFAMVRPILVYPFIPFALILAIFFATAAIVRLKVFSKFDTAILVWILFSATSYGAAIVHYFAAAGHVRDISLVLVVLISLVLTLLLLSRFLFVGWKLLRRVDANINGANESAVADANPTYRR